MVGLARITSNYILPHYLPIIIPRTHEKDLGCYVKDSTQFAFVFKEKRAVFCCCSPATDKGFEAKKDISSDIMFIHVSLYLDWSM